MIKWDDPNCFVTPHFTVRNCLWLNSWNRMADESDGLNDEIKNNLVATCENAEMIRDLLYCKLRITSMYRPKIYSPIVGGTEHDVHTMGIAFDFIPFSMSTDVAKDYIRPVLEKFNLRMERDTKNWIHIDSHKVGPSGREFNP